MEEDSIIKRIFESNIFTESEKNMINKNATIFEKCYLLGVLDAK